MEIKIDFTKSPQENAGDYYTKAKKLEQKRLGIEKTIADLEAKLEKSILTATAPGKAVTAPSIRQKKEWYEKFHWFFTSSGALAIGGRDAQQNEALNSKYFDEGDLFFHADIFGASVVVLKGGVSASDTAKLEAAQFAASYSSAWKAGLSSVDVYAMRRGQVSKSTSKGSLGTGSFLLSGEREWYRGTELGLAAFSEGGKLKVVPMLTVEKLHASGIASKFVELGIGKEKKSDAAKRISKALGVDDLDSIIQQLPAGGFSVIVH